MWARLAKAAVEKTEDQSSSERGCIVVIWEKRDQLRSDRSGRGSTRFWPGESLMKKRKIKEDAMGLKASPVDNAEEARDSDCEAH